MKKVAVAHACHVIVLAGLLGLVVSPCSSVFGQQRPGPDGANPRWEVLERCRLAAGTIPDGDSFRVQHRDRVYIFRLYFVDSPESDASLDQRLRDQAAYFGISTNDIPRAAQLASEFTRQLLTDKEFTVITRWQNAMGRSRMARFYAVVLVGGKNLAEELVANGHARIYGLRANWPGGPNASTFINQLKHLEIKAREQKLGVWDDGKFPRFASGAGGGVSAASSPIPPQSEPALINLNTASYEELQKLPRIGPKLAERIIAHRPYKSADDLERVAGIGPATIEQLKPLVTFEPAR